MKCWAYKIPVPSCRETEIWCSMTSIVVTIISNNNSNAQPNGAKELIWSTVCDVQRLWKCKKNPVCYTECHKWVNQGIPMTIGEDYRVPHTGWLAGSHSRSVRYPPGPQHPFIDVGVLCYTLLQRIFGNFQRKRERELANLRQTPWDFKQQTTAYQHTVVSWFEQAMCILMTLIILGSYPVWGWDIFLSIRGVLCIPATQTCEQGITKRFQVLELN